MQKSNKSIYDVAIVGAGLTGLSLAVALQRLGKKVALLDEGEKLGGSNSPATYENYQFDKGIRFLPDSEETEKAISYLEEILGQDIPCTSTENKRLAYESGEMKEFLGFGDQAPEYVDELEYFFSAKELVPELTAHEWITALREVYHGSCYHPAYVTRFHVHEGQISHLTYNTNKELYAEHYVYCGNLREVLPLFSRDFIPSKVHQKIAKSTIWTCLYLDILHQVSTDNKDIHVLNYNTKDEPEYFIGRFAEIAANPIENEEEETAPESSPLIVSSWMALLDREVTEDSEQVATLIKKMKRQLKKVYPEAFEAPIQERLGLVPAVLGQIDLGLKNPLQFPAVKNFYLGSAQLSEQKNLLGSLHRSQLLARHFEKEVFPEPETPIEPPAAEL